LTDFGKSQAAAVPSALAADEHELELFVISPLRRTLQTSEVIFSKLSRSIPNVRVAADLTRSVSGY
jgi:broad specificity phosphatase PhoE